MCYPNLYKIFQFLLQTLACEEYAALHRSEGQVQFLCDFTVFKTGYVHREWYFIFLRQRVDDAVHLFQVISAFRTSNPES